MLNNGHASKHFILERGPLSGMLFVIAIEFLVQTIRRSRSIKGITIQPNQEVKLSQFADDSAAFLADTQSVSNLFDLLHQFEKCSGLKINQSKLEKNALAWISMSPERRNSQPPAELRSKKTLNMWSQRDLSLYGKINIVKTLALSKLIFICSVLESPENFADEVNKIIFDFIWNYKQPKYAKQPLLRIKKKEA